MNANITETYETAAKTAASAANNAGQLVVKNIEKMIELQMGSAKVYADALLSNAREALEVRDGQSARSYFEKQPEVVRGIVQRMTKDSGEIMELGRTYADEAQALFTRSAVDLGAVVQNDAKAKKDAKAA
ncbi:MAG: phasin family protein [Arenicellales bacterium]